MLETAQADPLTEFHLGVAQWHAGDVAQAVRSWERGLALAPSRWPLLRCLAVADVVAGDPARAAQRFAEAFEDLAEESRGGEPWTAAESALGREAMTTLLAAGRLPAARAVWDRLRPSLREEGRFRLLAARLLAAEGHVGAARRVFEEGFELPDLREGDEILSEVWARVTDRPLPPRTTSACARRHRARFPRRIGRPGSGGGSGLTGRADGWGCPGQALARISPFRTENQASGAAPQRCQASAMAASPAGVA